MPPAELCRAVLEATRRLRAIAARRAAIAPVPQARQRARRRPEISREEFFEYGLRTATNYDRTFADTADKLADMLEEEFEAGGSRGGFMMVHPQAVPRDLLNVVDLLVPELQRRSRFRKAYDGKTLKENLLED